MRYRITEPFTDNYGTTWATGDKFRPHEDDDPQIYFDKGLLEDASQPPGNNAVTPQQKQRAKEQQEAQAKEQERDKAIAEGRDWDAEQKAERDKNEYDRKTKAEGRGTGSETHAKDRDAKSGESEHKGGKSK